jgi:predicted class III extradiol MEMO1 family dioxygenase
MLMIKVELTEREFECLLGHMEVDEEIFKELVDELKPTDPNDYTLVMLGLIKKFRNLQKNYLQN